MVIEDWVHMGNMGKQEKFTFFFTGNGLLIEKDLGSTTPNHINLGCLAEA